jgi:YggT family protein
MSIHWLVAQLFNFYSILIVIYCVFTWFPLRNGGFLADVFAALTRICAPYLNIFRRFIPSLGGIDISPILAILVLELIGNGLGTLLIRAGL